jgi:hypothetical protein
MVRRTVQFFALFFVALTSGAAFCIWLDSNPFRLSPSFYAEMMQHAIRAFTIALNIIAISGVILTLILTFLVRRDHLNLYLLIAASICAVAATLITIFGNVPIINQIMTWNVDSPPSNSMEVAERWWVFQTVRTILVVIQLSCLIASAMIRRES